MSDTMLMLSNRAIRFLVMAAALGPQALPAAAQYGTVAAADPGTSLAGALRILSSEPRNFQALIAAGRASLDMGDTQAAAGFYGRAEEAAPQSPVPKIGIGAAMTLMGEARGAMTYFDRASALGSPQSLLALDRGLAFDLLGQQSKAQSDYRAAMFGAQANEARRRLALSLAISRDFKGATATLDPLLRSRDAAAVRTNAFVQALAGDREGARRTIDTALPGAGARFEPFFRLLPGLRPEEKAMAVHLGEFPRDAAQRFASAERIPASPARSIGKPSEVRVPSPRRSAPVQVTPPRNATAKPLEKAEIRAAAREPVEPLGKVRKMAPPSTTIAASPPAPDPSRLASAQPKLPAPVVSTPDKAAQPDPGPRPGFTADELMPVAEASEPLVPVGGLATVNSSERIVTEQPAVVAQADIAPPPRPTPKLEIKRPPASKPKVELAKLDVPKAKAKPKVELAKLDVPKAKAKPKAEKETPKANVKKPASPYFVQLASGANADRMGIEFKRIKAKKPALFAGKLARVTNGKELFRLVIGPFKDRDDSGAFVNQLAKAGIDGFTYTAPDGMTFEKIATK